MLAVESRAVVVANGSVVVANTSVELDDTASLAPSVSKDDDDDDVCISRTAAVLAARFKREVVPTRRGAEEAARVLELKGSVSEAVVTAKVAHVSWGEASVKFRSRSNKA
eukprot:1566162-Rhodomonas_salina.2